MGSGEGSERTLASSPSDKKRATKYMEEHQIPDTRAAARMAAGGGTERPSFLAPSAPAGPLAKQDAGMKGLSGWASDQGVSDALVAWQGQANRLMGRLQQELNALKGTQNIFQNQDLAAGAQTDSIRLPSSLDGM
ncbi:hypothetical protein ABWJ92_28105 [Streptomyces sp. NPDC000609]|uniref:hypothetical protein n=1 Tax=Streptomyces sp. NPDC000609 TaxID=3160957 RepID=UPI0033914C28